MPKTLGRQPKGTGEGPGGKCVCPKCGHIMSHVLGKPCYEVTCPKCGGEQKMIRKSF